MSLKLFFLPSFLPCFLPFFFFPSFFPFSFLSAFFYLFIFVSYFFFLFFVILVFGDWDFLCIPGCPGRHSVDQGGLELKNPLPLPPKCWELRHGPPHGPGNTKTLKAQKIKP